MLNMNNCHGVRRVRRAPSVDTDPLIPVVSAKTQGQAVINLPFPPTLKLNMCGRLRTEHGTVLAASGRRAGVHLGLVGDDSGPGGGEADEAFVEDVLDLLLRLDDARVEDLLGTSNRVG